MQWPWEKSLACSLERMLASLIQESSCYCFRVDWIMLQPCIEKVEERRPSKKRRTGSHRASWLLNHQEEYSVVKSSNHSVLHPILSTCVQIMLTPQWSREAGLSTENKACSWLRKYKRCHKDQEWGRKGPTHKELIDKKRGQRNHKLTNMAYSYIHANKCVIHMSTIREWGSWKSSKTSLRRGHLVGREVCYMRLSWQCKWTEQQGF